MLNPPEKLGVLEYFINEIPFWSTLLYRKLLRLAGVRLGRNVIFTGRINVRFRGNPSNILIEDNVTLGRNVEIWNRGDAKITLRSGVYIEGARLVTARNGILDIGSGTRLSRGVIINATEKVNMGKFCIIGANVTINSGKYRTNRGAFICDQMPQLGPIEIGDDVFIGAGTTVMMNSRIGEGAIIGSNSLVSGEIDPFTVCYGTPAAFVRHR